jgi:hypothetical protein
MTVRRRAAAVAPLVAASLLVLLLAAGCIGRPGQPGDLSQGELLLELSDTINELRSHDALLQEELDSLRGVVAHQDTTIARIAAAAGVPLTP